MKVIHTVMYERKHSLNKEGNQPDIQNIILNIYKRYNKIAYREVLSG